MRVLWVSAHKLNEINYSKMVTYTPVKMMKHVREIIENIDKHIIGDATQTEILVKVCDKLRDIFDKITKTHCCISIKVVEGNDDGTTEMTPNQINELPVHNIVRDSNHSSRDTEEYKSKKHYIRENTAFSTIIGNLGKKWFYLNNDIDVENSYSTTSPYTDDDPLPYKSELVRPIVKKIDDQKFSFIGFLCVDSEEKNVFQKEGVQMEITTMMVDILYWVITSNNYIKNTKNETKETK